MKCLVQCITFCFLSYFHVFDVAHMHSVAVIFPQVHSGIIISPVHSAFRDFLPILFCPCVTSGHKAVWNCSVRVVRGNINGHMNRVSSFEIEAVTGNIVAVILQCLIVTFKRCLNLQMFRDSFGIFPDYCCPCYILNHRVVYVRTD